MSEITGINERYYPSETNPMRQRITVVLVAGQIGDYAAYAGDGSPEWIKRFGDKLSFEEACCHFPGGQLRKDKYRE